MAGRKQAEHYYNETSRTYERTHTKGYFEFINRFELDALGPLLEKNGSALEVGCGSGIILGRVSKKAGLAVGVDLSPGMLAIARKKGLKACMGDAAGLPFKSNRFNVVYSFKVLPHIPELGAALREMARVARPNGFVVLEFYNSRSAKRLLKALFPTRTFTKYYSRGSFRALLPGSLAVQRVLGCMAVAPSCVVFDIPLLNRGLAIIERAVSGTFLKSFGSHIIFVCRKECGGQGFL